MFDTAHKLKTKCSEIMRYAVVTRRAARDPTVDLKGALMPIKHYARITYPSEVGGLMRAIDSGGYLFPSIRSYHQPISNNTVNAASRRMGYTKDENSNGSSGLDFG